MKAFLKKIIIYCLSVLYAVLEIKYGVETLETASADAGHIREEKIAHFTTYYKHAS